MIALIPGLMDTLAFLRPEAKTPKEGFTQVLESAQSQAQPRAPAPPPQYVVQPGDHLWGIAKKLGYPDPMELARVNHLKDPNRLKIGQILQLPEKPRSGPLSETAALSATTSVDSGKTSSSSSPNHPQAIPNDFASPSGKSQKSVSVPVAFSRGPGRLVVASWYGASHHGQEMANGQPFNMYADTAAHRSLPLGTYLELTNPRNGQSALVEVTDRGPFIQGRSLDISYGVARKLGVVQQGVARLLMKKVEPS